MDEFGRREEHRPRNVSFLATGSFVLAGAHGGIAVVIVAALDFFTVRKRCVMGAAEVRYRGLIRVHCGVKYTGRR